MIFGPTVTTRTAVLFGGSGFIGGHLARHLLATSTVDRVVLADIRSPTHLAPDLRDRVSYVEVDVRRAIATDVTGADVVLVANLAAVHREPGHQPREYYETNVGGADAVCAYATAVGCKTMMFTSSIAVYGPTEDEKDEHSLPVPMSPYGGSKLVAERIHLGWQQAQPGSRQMLIVRPGVVFGPHEGGNVTRLVRAVSRGYFFFTGNHHVRKAGGYVKELCHSIELGLAQLRTSGGSLLFNFTQNPTPRLDELVAAVATVAGRKMPQVSLPYLPLLAASHLAQAASTLLGVEQPLHPVRARKIVHSNNISSKVLPELGYAPRYTLRAALEDWKRDLPEDWRR